MQLYFSTPSAFSRKVRLVAAALGITDRITLVAVNPTTDIARLRAVNPLGKIPVLVDQAGTAIFDSPVICRYLDERYGPHGVIPANAQARLVAGTLEALADGITEAGMLLRAERMRSDHWRDDKAADHQRGKIATSLDYLESIVDAFGEDWTLGQIAIVATLGWLEFRLADEGFLNIRPKTRAWLASVSGRPDVRETAPR